MALESLMTMESPTSASVVGNASPGDSPRMMPALPGVPATVVTTPAAVILRMAELRVSLT